MSKGNINQGPELSRPLSVDKIPMGGMVEHIIASKDERRALAERFGLVDVPKLEANLNIDLAQGRMIAVAGSFDAEIVQTCVVSLESFQVHLTDKLDVLFAPPSFFKDLTHENHADQEEPDGPEPILDGEIDLGELVSQHLALAIDPYPRKPGVSFGAALHPDDAVLEGKVKPFANLAELLEKGKKK